MFYTEYSILRHNPNSSHVCNWWNKLIRSCPPIHCNGNISWVIQQEFTVFTLTGYQLHGNSIIGNMFLLKEDCVFILEYYFATKSFAAVHKAFPLCIIITMIQMRQHSSNAWTNLRKHSVWDGKHVRPVTVLTYDMVNNVEEMVTQSPRKSLRRLWREIGLHKANWHWATS